MNIIEQQYQYLEMVWFGLKCQSYKKTSFSNLRASIKDYFVSHSWGHPFVSSVATLSNFLKGADGSHSTAFWYLSCLWFCFYRFSGPVRPRAGSDSLQQSHVHRVSHNSRAKSQKSTYHNIPKNTPNDSCVSRAGNKTWSDHNRGCSWGCKMTLICLWNGYSTARPSPKWNRKFQDMN